MSLDRSLKGANALIRHRNVLTRDERLLKLTEDERWNESKSVFGLPKVGHRKQALAKVVKEETAEGTPAVAGATPAAGAPAAAGAKAPAGKAAPAAAAPAKAAAPAAKKK
jgi:small basic protein (TIGR04137 family)